MRKSIACFGDGDNPLGAACEAMKTRRTGLKTSSRGMKQSRYGYERNYRDEAGTGRSRSYIPDLESGPDSWPSG